MALGDYAKTTYVEGSAPGISAARLNANENKTQEIDDAFEQYVRTPAFGEIAGAVNVYTFDGMHAIALVDGMSVYLDNVIAANTGAATFNWSGLGARAIVDAKGAALVAGKMPLNCIVGLRYNASTISFQLLGEGGDTLTGDMVAADLAAGKTGYSNNPASKITGTATVPHGSEITTTPGTHTLTVPANVNKLFIFVGGGGGGGGGSDANYGSAGGGGGGSYIGSVDVTPGANLTVICGAGGGGGTSGGGTGGTGGNSSINGYVGAGGGGGAGTGGGGGGGAGAGSAGVSGDSGESGGYSRASVGGNGGGIKNGGGKGNGAGGGGGTAGGGGRVIVYW